NTLPLSVRTSWGTPWQRRASAKWTHTALLVARAMTPEHTTNREWSSMPVSTLHSVPSASRTPPTTSICHSSMGPPRSHRRRAAAPPLRTRHFELAVVGISTEAGRYPKEGVTVSYTTYLAPDPSEVSRARRFIREGCQATYLRPEALQGIVLAVSEACANAVEYAGASKVKVTWD